MTVKWYPWPKGKKPDDRKSDPEYAADLDEAMRKGASRLQPGPTAARRPPAANGKPVAPRDLKDPEAKRKAFYDMLERDRQRDANRPPSYKPPRDLGHGVTPQRRARAGGDIERIVLQNEGNETITTERVLDGSILDKLLSRHAITGDQYHAGAQFYRDWYASGLAASGVVDMEKPMVDNSPKPDPVARLTAATAYATAVKSIGLVHSHAVTALVLTEEPLENYGRRRFRLKDGKDARLAATTALRCGLDELDVHYNGTRKRGRYASQASGARPEIQGETPGRRVSTRTIKVRT